jgi:hypothetical protein
VLLPDETNYGSTAHSMRRFWYCPSAVSLLAFGRLGVLVAQPGADQASETRFNRSRNPAMPPGSCHEADHLRNECAGFSAKTKLAVDLGNQRVE